jgi:CRISPR/Cas system-associated exonuclease Cas4 (RecB family)
VIALSASKITTYLQCARKYRFRYVDHVPPAWKASALALGSAVHGALETFHMQRAAGATMTPESVAGLFRIDLAAELAADEIHYKEDESGEDLAATGVALVRMYATQNQHVAVRAAEVPFELPVTDGIMLRGVFDVLLENHRVRELKTAARDWDEGTLSRHVQISAYAWAYRVLFGYDAVIEVVAMLKLKHPRIESHEVARTTEQQSWFVGLVIEIARAIEAKVYPPNPSWACSDCEYGEQCRGMGGGP